MATGSSDKEEQQNKSLRDTLLGFINDAMLPFVHHAGITMPQLQTLRMLEQKPHTSQELAQKLCVSPSAVTQLVDKLVAKNLVSRMKQPPNLRVVWLQSTPQGMKVLAEFEDIIRRDKLAEHLVESSIDVHQTVIIDFDESPRPGSSENTIKTATSPPYSAAETPPALQSRPHAPAKTESPANQQLAKQASHSPERPIAIQPDRTDTQAEKLSVQNASPAPGTTSHGLNASLPEKAAFNETPAQAQPEDPQQLVPDNIAVEKPSEKFFQKSPASIPSLEKSAREAPASAPPQTPSVHGAPESTQPEQPKESSKVAFKQDKPLARTIELLPESEDGEKKPPRSGKSMRMSDYYQMIRRNIKK